MTVEEITSLQAALKKKTDRRSIWFLILFFFLLFGNAALSGWIEKTCPEFYWISAIILVATLLYGIVFIIKLLKMNNQYLPVCPGCGKQIAAAHIPIIIASGNCPMCGGEIIAKDA